MLTYAVLIGWVLGIATLVAYIRAPDKTQWNKFGKGWRRLRHGNWDYTEDKDEMLHR